MNTQADARIVESREQPVPGPAATDAPSWSVVVIARDEEATIGECLASIHRAFADRRYELIVVDSASRDRTVEIASRYTARILRLPATYPLRPSVGRHVGLGMARGEWVLFVDGDSILDAAWVDAAEAAFAREPNLAGVSGASQAILRDEDGAPRLLGDQYPDAIYDSPEHLSGSAAYRRAALHAVGGFNPYLYAHEEPELGARLREEGFHLRRLRIPMTRHFPKHRKESVAELIRRVRRRYPIGLGQFARHMLQRRMSAPSPWAPISRHLQFATLLLTGVVCIGGSVLSGSRWPILAWTAIMTSIFAVFALRTRSLRRPAYYFLEWALTSPYVVWGLLLRPQPIGSFDRRHPLRTASSEHAMDNRQPSRIRESVFVALLLAVGTAIALMGAELLTRVAAPQLLYRYPRGFYENHSTRGYTVTSGFDALVDTPEYSVRYAFNRRGQRGIREYGAKAPGTFRIIMLGDSFTMGAGVEEDQTFVRQVDYLLQEAAAVPVEVINAGVPGYGTREEAMVLAESLRELDPDLAVLNFFVGNDLADNARPGLLRVVDGELVESNVPRGFLPLAVRGFLSRHSHLYHILWPYQRMVLGGGTAMKVEQREALRQYGPPDAPNVQPMWRATTEWIERTATIARSNEVPLAAVLIPDPLQVDPPAFESLLQRLELPPTEYTRAQPDRRLVEIFTANATPVLDLLPTFERAASPSSLYFPLDKHWTPEGHALAGRTIADFLMRDGLVPTRR